MPANETVERLAAAAWVQYLVFDNNVQLGLRAQVSCQNRLLVTTFQGGVGNAAFVEAPLIVVPFDREFTRRECTVIAQFVQTIESVNRIDYPFYNSELDGTAFADMTAPPDTRLLYCPCHLDWIGDPRNPSWLPFGMGGGTPNAVPLGFDVDLFNAVALCPRGTDDEGYVATSGDIVVHVFKHPPVPPVQTLIEDVIEVMVAV